MSDYLSSLAARTLRREPSCEPRRAQMFEPRQETTASPFSELEREGFPVTETVESDATRSLAIFERDDDVGPKVGIETSAHTAHTTLPRVEGDESNTDSYTWTSENIALASERAPHSAPSVEPVREAKPTLTARRAETQSVTPEPQSPPIVIHPSAVVADSTRLDRVTQATPPAKVNQTLIDSEPLRAVDSEARASRADAFDEKGREQAPAVVRRVEVESQGSATLVDVEVVPQTRSDSGTLSRGELQPATPNARAVVIAKPADQTVQVPLETRAESSQTPPTIEVTIGRIEVRAVTPPAPPPSSRQRQAPPKMSLDDYLRAQSGGRS